LQRKAGNIPDNQTKVDQKLHIIIIIIIIIIHKYISNSNRISKLKIHTLYSGKSVDWHCSILLNISLADIETTAYKTVYYVQ